MECPSCQNQVHVTESNFGALFTCPSCQAVYFIGFDGIPQFESNSESSLDQPLDLDSVDRDPILPQNPMDQAPQFGSDNEFKMNPILQSSSGEIDVNASGFSAQIFSNQERLDPVAPTQMKSKSRALPQEAKLTAHETLKDVLEEINDFGNSSVDSPLRYNVLIDGLDTKELVDQLLEAISDKKFGLLTSDIAKKIRNGRCEIKGLNPVAAFVLAKRIQFIEIQSTWSFENAI